MKKRKKGREKEICKDQDKREENAKEKKREG